MESRALRVSKETEALEEREERRVSRENRGNLAPVLLQPILFK
jgi:hypothetical protein